MSAENLAANFEFTIQVIEFMNHPALATGALVRLTSSINTLIGGGVADVRLTETLNKALHFGQSAPQELQDFLEAVGALLSWSLVNDKKNICMQCVPALQENALVYMRNTGGSKPSALWCTVAMKFVEKWKDLQAKLESNPGLWQLDVSMDLFSQTEFLLPVNPPRSAEGVSRRSRVSRGAKSPPEDFSGGTAGSR